MKKTKNTMPTTPGEILKAEFLSPLKITQKKLADHLGVDIKVINRLINGKTSLSLEMALNLAAAFKTSPEFWLNAERAVALFKLKKKVKGLPKPLV